MDERIDYSTMLKKRRELLGYSIERVARGTNIRPGMIEDIESGDLGRMPPRGYAVGILTSYARFVDLDPTEVLDDYRSQLDKHDRRKESVGESVSRRRRSGPENPPIASGREAVRTDVAPFEIHWKLGLAVAAVVALVGLGVWGIVSSLDKDEPVTPPLPNTSQIPTTTPDPGITEEPTSTVGQGTTVDEPAAGEPFTIEIEVPAGSASWVEVTVDGARGYAGTMVGPATETFEVADAISVLIGKTDGVVVTRDGEKIDVPIENNVGVLELSVQDR